MKERSEECVVLCSLCSVRASLPYHYNRTKENTTHHSHSNLTVLSPTNQGSTVGSGMSGWDLRSYQGLPVKSWNHQSYLEL